MNSALMLLSLLILSQGCGDDSQKASEFAVGGTVAGLVGMMELVNGFDVLPVQADGPFQFTEAVATGSPYDIRVLTQPMDQICTVANGRSSVESVDIENVTVECLSTSTALASLSVSLGELDPAFAMDLSAYGVQLGTFTTHVRVDATALDPEATVAIADNAPELASASKMVRLAEGQNHVEILVRSPQGAERSYAAFLHRSNASNSQYFKAFNAEGDNLYGTALAIDGDTLAVGAIFRDAGLDLERGAVYLYRRIDGSWVEEGFLPAPSGTPSQEQFGGALALQGDTLVVGASGEDAAGDVDTGAVYVYTRTNGAWTTSGVQLVSPEPLVNGLFGAAVAIDGSAIVVGEPGLYGGGSGYIGQVHVFRYDGSGWPLEASLSAFDSGGQGGPIVGAGFGFDVDIDGARLGVTARYESSNTGAVYLFDEVDGSWSSDRRIVAANADPNDYFGTSISISGDTIAIGSPFEDSGATGIYSTNDGNVTPTSNSGAVYAYSKEGSQWSLEAYIKPELRRAPGLFGWSVSLQGDMLGVGAMEATNDDGAAYVFLRDDSGQWFETAVLHSENPSVGDRLGFDVSVDGQSMAAGAPREDSDTTVINGPGANDDLISSGAAYVFQ